MADLAIFDLDGTLHRTEAALTPAIRMALREVGAEVPPDDRIEATYGEPIPVLAGMLMPGAGEKAHQAFVSALRRTQARTIPESAQAYDGVPAMLEELREAGWKLAICSNAGDSYIELVIGALGLRHLFSALSGLVQDRTKEQRIGDLARASGGVAVVIGDRYLDFEAASANGLPSIACAWGYGKREELASATLVAQHPSEIPALMERLKAEG
jgi:phosphoglycolate phosphatase